MAVDCVVTDEVDEVPCQYHVTPATVLEAADKVPVVQAGLAAGIGAGGAAGVEFTVKTAAVVVKVVQGTDTKHWYE